ncbi:unnamed protein product [Parnassius apollo]|uniref:(apollo) hypothetical protein n=1 Tax=Parnassius apollo TaxID=110799 RepID=A0A8S3WBM0_PARAO|nr:unnamed protein product [Parnassius apollo]
MLSSPATQTNQLFVNEQIIRREVQERKKRENNIIIVGISEQNFTSTEERILKDEVEVLNITSIIEKDIPKPNKIFRIGKYNPGKQRRVKVCFDKPETAKVLNIFSDRLNKNEILHEDKR